MRRLKLPDRAIRAIMVQPTSSIQTCGAASCFGGQVQEPFEPGMGMPEPRNCARCEGQGLTGTLPRCWQCKGRCVVANYIYSPVQDFLCLNCKGTGRIQAGALVAVPWDVSRDGGTGKLPGVHEVELPTRGCYRVLCNTGDNTCECKPVETFHVHGHPKPDLWMVGEVHRELASQILFNQGHGGGWARFHGIMDQFFQLMAADGIGSEDYIAVMQVSRVDTGW